MSKTRQQKEDIVDHLAEQLKSMQGAAFSSIHGYTMTDADSMRAKGREVGVKMTVAKKTLLKLAAQKAGVDVFDPSALDGSILFAIGQNDPISAAKLLSDLVKTKENMKILGGILEGALIAPEKVKQLAGLPSREALLAKLVGSLNAPISGFVNVLAGNLRGLVNVLNAIKDAKA